MISWWLHEVLFAGYCEAQSKKLRKKMGVRELFSSRNHIAHIYRRLIFPHRVDEAALVQFLNEDGVGQVRRIFARQRAKGKPRKIHSVVSRIRGRSLRADRWRATQTTISRRSSSATRGAILRPLSLAKSTIPASVKLMISS